MQRRRVHGVRDGQVLRGSARRDAVLRAVCARRQRGRRRLALHVERHRLLADHDVRVELLRELPRSQRRHPHDRRRRDRERLVPKSDAFQEFQYSFTQVGRAFSRGDTLTVAGSGAKVPAFAAESLVAPGQITLASPTPGARGEHVDPDPGAARPRVERRHGGGLGLHPGRVGGRDQRDDVWLRLGRYGEQGHRPGFGARVRRGRKGDLSWGQQSAPRVFKASAYAVDYLAVVVGSAPASFE